MQLILFLSLKTYSKLALQPAQWTLREHSSAFDRQVWGSDMSSQETPQARRFPIEAGDSPSLATAPETQEPVAPERTATRQLRRCPGCHCLTLPNVPIDVYIAMGGSHRPRTT
ncbi:Hypothetical predicted protein [Podarcis lilfordi]|uniref:Family with sequence similarity 229 member A n=1 Tax=Podarcis lilfordi TaxID=74358 RepID=A0AA35KQN3_9SAUR|nr:Hypothetical predicted protein [Podarcis lilfordi]